MAHADRAGSLHVLVISSAAGLLAGSFLWRRVFGRCGVRGMLVMSGTLSTAAALVCLANEVIPDREQLWVHMVIVLALAVIAATVAVRAPDRPPAT